MERYEVLVIGGGPAGLSAALYLARYDRHVALFDNGRGRSTWHQVIRNYVGFPGGIHTRDLRELGYKQLEDYPQVQCIPRKIESLRRENGGFVAEGQAESWYGQAVILCTGVVDHYPRFEGWEAYVGRSMFWCITCDGYGCRGVPIVVTGNTNAAASEALQLQRFTQQITLLTDSDDLVMEEKFQQRLKNANIPLIRDKITSVKGKDGYLEGICTEQGRWLPCEQLFSHQGSTPQSKLARDIAVELSSQGYIETDVEQQTNIPGVFAAGDVTRIFAHQFSTAVHEGGQAASAANYYLYPPELKDD